MKRILKEVTKVEDWGGVKSPSFKSFARKFKNDLAKELAKYGCEITAFNTGHYYISGFFRNENDDCFYFYISDVRYFPLKQIMYRIARDEKDFTGGRNCFVTIEEDMTWIYLE